MSVLLSIYGLKGVEVDYSEHIAKLCQTNELLRTNLRGQAIELALPVLELMNHQLFDAIRDARYIQPKYKRLYVTKCDFWMVMVAQGLLRTSLSSVIALGWNKRFEDNSDDRTLLGTLVRTGKRYGENDRQPDVLSIRALTALTTIAARQARQINNFDLIMAVPSTHGSANSLPATVTRSVGERLGCECVAQEAVRYVRSTRKMKDLGSSHEKFAEIKDSMLADSTVFRGRSVFLIDDMLESGATFRETARALRAAGATDVHALAMAHTRKFARETMNTHVDG